MLTILGIVGSLRRGSYNAALLRAAARVAPDGVSVELATIEGIPVYDRDVESGLGVPTSVQALKERIAAADGLLLATPEYNNSLPGGLKNAFDWLSRPSKDVQWVFGGRPVALMGATTGQGGTRLSQLAWLPVLRALGTRPWFGEQMQLARANDLFDEDCDLTDERTRRQLREFMASYSRFVRGERSGSVVCSSDTSRSCVVGASSHAGVDR